MTNHHSHHSATGLAVQRERWVCLDCRKMFRPYLAHGAVPLGRRAKAGTQHAPSLAAAPCPQCRQPMQRVGRYFKPPKQRNIKQWAKVRLLIAHGVDFHGWQAARPPQRPSEAAAYVNEHMQVSEAERLLRAIAKRNKHRHGGR
jgi:hypothetical protein